MRRFLVIALASMQAPLAFAQDRPKPLSLHCVPASSLRGGPVSSDISYSAASGWSIAHTFRDGRVVEQAQHYDMRDAGPRAWEGTQKKNNNLVMTGKVVGAGGRLKYVERLHDRSKGGKTISQLLETCFSSSDAAASLPRQGGLTTRPGGAEAWKNADASPAATPEPATNGAVPGDRSTPDFAMAALAALVAITPIVAIKLRARARKRRIWRVVNAAVVQHQRALIRKRFQTLRHDDYGNIIADHWMKELNYFLEKVIEPAVTTLGAKEALLYRAMRPDIFARVASMVEAQGDGLESFTLGPNVTPTDYEKFCAQQLRAVGWVANTTKASGDQGTDIVAEKGGVRLVVQCKLFSQPVGNKAVQEVAAARAHEQADCAAVVSNAKYTYSAQQLAATNQVLLLHHSDLTHIDELIAT